MTIYRLIKVPQKMPDAENFLNQMAADGWELKLYTPNGLGVFVKQGNP